MLVLFNPIYNYTDGPYSVDSSFAIRTVSDGNGSQFGMVASTFNQ
jgi:hypothetical protein